MFEALGRYEMAGKRQHFIPQFLQRGFLTRAQRNQEFTCVYRKNAAPFQANIKNVGVEGFFYSAAENDADEKITAAEDGLGRLVSELRRSDGALSETARLAELFAHLEVRSRHLRQSFLQTGTHLVNALLQTASDPTVFEPYVRQILRNDPSLLEEAFSKELRKLGLPRNALPMLVQPTDSLVERALPAIVPQIAMMVRSLRAKLPDRFTDAVKVGHIRTLEQEMAPSRKTAIFATLQFQMCRLPSASLLLGDSMVVFHVRGERSFKPFLDKKDELVAAILPIAADAALVGAAGPYALDVELIRCELARCSLELFIAGEESERNARLSSKIAENAHLLSNEEVQEIVRTLFTG